MLMRPLRSLLRQQVKQAAKRDAALERPKAKLAEERAGEAAAAGEQAKEVERLAAAVRAEEKQAKERGEALGAEREGRTKDLRWGCGWRRGMDSDVGSGGAGKGAMASGMGSGLGWVHVWGNALS